MKANFSKIVKDSVKITAHNKKLWVFGLVLAALGSGLSGSGGNYSKFTDNFSDQSEEVNNETTFVTSELLTANMPQVLGATTSTLMDVVRTIPASYYGVLALTILLNIFVFAAVAVYARSWAQSGLINGIDQENSPEPPSLYQMSDHGKRRAIEVIKLKIFPLVPYGLILIFASLLAIPILGTTHGAVNTLIKVLLVLVVVLATLVISASIQLGIIAMNIEGLLWKEAFGRGYRVFKKYVLDVAVMSVINCFAGCLALIALCIVLVLLGAFGAALVAGSAEWPAFFVAAVPIIFLALLATIVFLGLWGAITTVFQQTTWVLLYKNLVEKPSTNNG